MTKHFLTFILVLILGCQKKEIPEDILPVEKMAAILIDIHLAEGKIDEIGLREDTARWVFNHFEKEILQEHEVDVAQYRKSFNYHLADLKSMDQIYSIVVDTLNLKRHTGNID